MGDTFCGLGVVMKSAWLGAALAFGLCASSANAAVTYVYTGQTFSFIRGAYTATDRVTGSLTVAEELTTPGAFTPLSYSFSDGYQTITESTGDLAATAFSFDAFDPSGAPTIWQVLLQRFGNNAILSQHTADVAFSDNLDNIGDTSRSGPGAWTVIRPATVGGVPEPATWSLMILGFGALGATLRRRREVAA